MMKVRHTRDRERNYRINGLTFPTGTRVVELDPEQALEVTSHSQLELVNDLPTDYEPLQEIAMNADAEGVNGNTSRVDLLEWLDNLPETEREEVLEND